jgi:hypothetical protein
MYSRAQDELRDPKIKRHPVEGPEGSVPIHCDIREEGLFDTLAKVQKKFRRTLFDVITCDYPHNIQFKTRHGKTFLPY